ncbi:ergothioneine biosynthesis glutamate--cysteine ligase EgtA [Pseudonocardia sp. CA-107938]|uniref:ergothioneine biosynthesis glutamate--cysteine ligase EgtA n=1 Tax=Pseudonocardia sp. CA-107938 TaxID=3240021 RepID=UPI003D8F2909
MSEEVLAPEQAAPRPDPGPSVLRDCADAEAYVASVCFKHGPPRLFGVELEWLLHRHGWPDTGPDASTLRSALGAHTPTSLDPSAPALPLPAGSTVTVEPGGQIELASSPARTLAELVESTASDSAHLHRLLAGRGLVPRTRAAEPERPPTRVLDLPRYAAMEQSFDRHGPDGRAAMCSTAAVQVCLDTGETADIAVRWAALHALGPVLLGAFANSPRLAGRATGWKSARWRSWQRSDPRRTAPPPIGEGDPVRAWTTRVLASPVLCIRDDGPWIVPEHLTFAEWLDGGGPRPPTVDDLRYHVSTLFPPVRPHGHLEVRYVDMQPGRRWALPVAVLVALTAGPAVTEQALTVAEPAAGLWTEAAQSGLDHPVLARAATAVFELARSRVAELGAPRWLVDDLDEMTERQVRRGLCPADLPDTPEEER